jgi:CelD/BcsL family acetyltransferase involved in cellulose biosynthesis
MARPSPHLLHAWLVAWWRHFGETSELAVQVAYRGDKLVGALPLCVQQRHGVHVLTFLGAEQVTLADILLAPGEKAGVAAALAERAVATKHDYADFHGLPSSSRLTEALGPSRLQLIVRAEAPVLELDGLDWETYYAKRLSSKQRALHRRRIRQLAKLGTIETTVARTDEELAPALEEAFELHSLRWEGRPDRSDFGTETGRQFHREATAALAELEVPRIVTLRLDGRPIAFAYNLALERTMHCYRLAFDPELHRFSPGLVNRYDSLQDAFAEGVTRIEFLGGLERYKLELTDRTEPLHEGLGLAESVAGKVVVSARMNGVRLRRFAKRSPAIRRFYYEGLAPARRLLHLGSGS